MTLTRIHLSVLQNGLHSIYHAVEHLTQALQSADEEDAAAYDPVDGSVRVAARTGGTGWYVGEPYLKLPRAYGIKFSILHLIHGVELLVKAYLEQVAPGSTAERGRPGRTISMRAAARQLVSFRPGLLDPDHLDLVLRAGQFRNEIEHAELDVSWQAASRLALDFLSVANYLAYALHNIRLSELFGFDPYSEDGDPVGEAISGLFSERSAITEAMVQRLATEWAEQRPLDRLVRCLHCGARGVSVESSTCVACGASGDTEIGILMDELDDATKKLLALRREAGFDPPVS